MTSSLSHDNVLVRTQTTLRSVCVAQREPVRNFVFVSHTLSREGRRKYGKEEDHILVIAVAHQRRKPDYWVGRDETYQGVPVYAKNMRPNTGANCALLEHNVPKES